MNTLLAFQKKEFRQQWRTGKFFILGGIAVLVAIVNIFSAWITPILMDTLTESMNSLGVDMGDLGNLSVEVTALDSWFQFFGNMLVIWIAFLLIESRIFTGEYSSGTLVLSLTKGLPRYTVVVAKSVTLVIMWTLCYGLCFAANYIGNELLWDNSIALNLGLSVFNGWLFGIFLMALTVLFSTLFKANIGVLLGIGGTVIVCYLVGWLCKLSQYLPLSLSSGTYLIYGEETPGDYAVAIPVTAVLCIVCFAVSIPLFNKKQL